MFKSKKYLAFCATLLSVPAHADRVLVSLEQAGSVVVIDSEEGKVVNTISVGDRPRGLALSPDRKHLYVAVGGANAVKRIDLDTLSITDSYPRENAETFALSPDGRYLYASNDADNSLKSIDLDQHAELKRVAVGKDAEGVSVSPDGHWVISTSEGENAAQWLTAKDLSIAASTPVAPRPRYSRFTPDGKQLWVTSGGSPTMTIIDGANKQVIKTLSFDPPGAAADSVRPVGIRIDKNQRFGYVALGRANQIAVVDARNLTVVGYIPAGQRVWQVEFSPDENRLYAANGLSGDVSVIDLQSRRLLRSIVAGDVPWGIAVAP